MITIGSNTFMINENKEDLDKFRIKSKTLGKIRNYNLAKINKLIKFKRVSYIIK